MPDPLYSGRFTQGYAITASATTPIVAPGVNQIGCSAFLCLTAGNVVASFMESSTPVTFPVLAGTVYPFALKMFLPASTATIMGLK